MTTRRMCPSPAVAAVLLAVLVLANLAGSASAQNLLSSGGFEAPDVMWSNGKGIATYTFPALPSAVGWYIWHPFESGSIDQINCRTYPSNPRCNAPEGYQIIDINGNTHGGLCQWVFTPGAGAPCDVYFWYAPNTDGGPGVRSMQIGFTSGALGSVNFAYGLSSYTPWQWQLGRLRIVAPGSFATFCVYSTTYNTPFGTFLDNFQLYCSAPPEPSPSQTATWTPLPSQTRTSDPTKSNTASRTPDPSQTSTSSRTGTITRSPDPTPTNTRTGSKSQTASQTITPSNSETATHTQTASNTPSNSPTRTSSPTSTATASGSETSTRTSTNTGTVSISTSSTETSTSTVSTSFSSSNTRTPSTTPSVAASPSTTPSNSETSTFTPSSSSTKTGTGTVTPSSTVSTSFSATITASISKTLSNSITASQTVTGSATASLSFGASPSSSATSSDSATASATMSRSFSPTISISRSFSSSPTMSFGAAFIPNNINGGGSGMAPDQPGGPTGGSGGGGGSNAAAGGSGSDTGGSGGGLSKGATAGIAAGASIVAILLAVGGTWCFLLFLARKKRKQREEALRLQQQNKRASKAMKPIGPGGLVAVRGGDSGTTAAGKPSANGSRLQKKTSQRLKSFFAASPVYAADGLDDDEYHPRRHGSASIELASPALLPFASGGGRGVDGQAQAAQKDKKPLLRSGGLQKYQSSSVRALISPQDASDNHGGMGSARRLLDSVSAGPDSGSSRRITTASWLGNPLVGQKGAAFFPAPGGKQALSRTISKEGAEMSAPPELLSSSPRAKRLTMTLKTMQTAAPAPSPNVASLSAYGSSALAAQKKPKLTKSSAAAVVVNNDNGSDDGAEGTQSKSHRLLKIAGGGAEESGGSGLVSASRRNLLRPSMAAAIDPTLAAKKLVQKRAKKQFGQKLTADAEEDEDEDQEYYYDEEEARGTRGGARGGGGHNGYHVPHRSEDARLWGIGEGQHHDDGNRDYQDGDDYEHSGGYGQYHAGEGRGEDDDNEEEEERHYYSGRR